ncbi:cupin domain-containing protein [Nocardioides sp. LHD-245]|uniref:helix-turn-helix domain-containing protein n=1 Tax=Nocardioides sp. LHD-245 TaxID=3051387 RepID=UPI0027E023FA|nr:cupin domain-containing protein [Nocardioides sp. LHD-245]
MASSNDARTAVAAGDAADQAIAQIGARVRLLRSRQGLTLKEVASRTGVSVSMLSMLERGVASASVGTLVSVASALGVHMSDLFDRDEPEHSDPVRRLAEQPSVRTNEGARRRVAHNDVESGVELAVNEYEPGGASGPVATHHDGREFGMLISGTLTVELDGQTHTLKPGDLIAYPSDRPHRIINSGRKKAVAVWVNIEGP